MGHGLLDSVLGSLSIQRIIPPHPPISVPEIIDPVFAKTSPTRSFCMTENERFGLVFVKTGSINSCTVLVSLRKNRFWR
jgi:hypothetical protein